MFLKNMKMKSCFLLLLYFGLPCCREVYAENDHDVKRGMYPYMAFIYYSDPAVVDVTGQRFIRSAILIRPDWLVTTAIGPSLIDHANGFPKKTLLARTGAISIDPKFTLNEDEDEQEREIVQIVRPYNHSATQWWTTDISLLKTLLPFNMTSAVGVKALNTRQPTIDPKTCSILVYTKKFGNSTDDKSLMILNVEILPSSIDNCGSHFSASTMVCAADSENNKDAMYEVDFCHGNSGGPLICENEVIGLQTYIGNNCKQPHLYQLLRNWDTFITCGIEDKCQEENCGNICDVNFKDQPKIIDMSITPPVTHDTARDLIDFINVPSTPRETTNLTYPTVTTIYTTSTEITTTSLTTITATAPTNITEISTIDVTEETDISTEEQVLTSDTTETSTTANIISPETTSTTDESSSSTIIVTEESTVAEPTINWPKVKETHQRSWPKVKELKSNYKNENDTRTTWPSIIDTTVMKEAKTPRSVIQKIKPKQKMKSDSNREDESEDVERKVNIEAQQHGTEMKLSGSNRKMYVTQILLFGFMVLLCL